jgi:hypothetical protein
MLSVRLACIKHAASVHPEPGSNSPQKNFSHTLVCLRSSFFLSGTTRLCLTFASYHSSVVKVLFLPNPLDFLISSTSLANKNADAISNILGTGVRPTNLKTVLVSDAVALASVSCLLICQDLPFAGEIILFEHGLVIIPIL